MPNRYVREAAIKSKSVNSLSWQGEVFWRRLINLVDDFGRYYADPELLRADVFPRQLDRVRDSDIPRLLAECEKAGLLFCFEADSKPFLVMNQWEKGRALHSSYPEPPPAICEQMKTSVYICKQMSPTPTPTPVPTHSPTPAQTPTSKSFSSMLTEGGVGGVISRILSNRDGWDYDNSRVKLTDFSDPALKTLLRPFVGRVKPQQAVEAFRAAAALTDEAAKLGKVKTTVGAYCTDEFKRQLEAVATNQKP